MILVLLGFFSAITQQVNDILPLLQEQGLAVFLAVVLVLFMIWFIKRQQTTIETYIRENTKAAETLITTMENFIIYIKHRDRDQS